MLGWSQLGHRLGPCIEATDELRIVGEFGADHLHRDLLTNRRLKCPIDRSESALADALAHLVAAHREPGGRTDPLVSVTERGVADDNALLERPDGRRWFDAQILAEAGPQAAEGPERVRLPARPVQGQHQLLGESLAGGILACERFQLADQLGCESPTEIGVEPKLDGLQTQFVEPSDLCLGEGLIGDVCVGTAMPERQSLADDKRCRSWVRFQQTPAFSHQLLEFPGVKLRRSDLQLVTGCPGEQHCPLRPLLAVWLESSPQMRDVNPEGVLMTGRRILSPQFVDDPVGGDHLV